MQSYAEVAKSGRNRDSVLIEKQLNTASPSIPSGKIAVLLSAKKTSDKPKEDLDKYTELLNDGIYPRDLSIQQNSLKQTKFNEICIEVLDKEPVEKLVQTIESDK